MLQENVGIAVIEVLAAGTEALHIKLRPSRRTTKGIQEKTLRKIEVSPQDL